MDSREEEAEGTTDAQPSGAAGSRTLKDPAEEKTSTAGRQQDRRLGEDAEQSQRDIYNIKNTFYQNVDSLHMGSQSGSGDARPRRSGKFDVGEVAEELVWFVEPPGYDEAAIALADSHVVVIAGGRGSGRRCGAMALLRGRVEGNLILLPPKLSVIELAGYRFEADLGYLIHGVDEMGDDDEQAAGWRGLRKMLAEQGSYLVITADIGLPARRTRGRPTTLPWRKPELNALLARYLGESAQLEDIRVVIEGVGDNLSMEDLHAFLIKIVNGVEVEEAAAQILDTSARDEVAKWFDSGPEPSRIADVVAAAFFPDVSERDFEMVQGDLLERIAPELPADRSEREQPARILNSIRKERWDSSSLLRLRYGGVASAVRRVSFEDPKYLPCVLAELDRRFDRQFWSEVADWLTETVDQIQNGELLVQLGQSLALLARTALPEVEDSYFERWSCLEPGSHHQQVIVYTLYWMATLDGLDDYALGTARHWARRGGESKQWIAAVAFGGALGLAYPAEAINQLWRLIERNPRSPLPSIALATLFGSFVEIESPYASRLLAALHTRLESLMHTGGKDREKLTAALRTTVWVLAEKGSRKSLPRSVELFRRGSAKAQDRIGRLWAMSLLYLAVRSDAASALVDALRLLTEADPADLQTIDLLGQLIHQSLRPDQVAGVRQTLVTSASRKRKATAPVISILLRWFNLAPTSDSLA
jgi:hypothetical protein